MGWDFFIKRPIFSAVLSLIIVLVGGLALLHLPLSQYPQIAPPTVTVVASYPGASPEALVNNVAAPLEEQINGVEGLLYYSSNSSSSGALSITVTFENGVDPDMATILVANRVKLAEPRLPEEVRRLGVITKKRSNDILMSVSIVSPKATRDSVFLSNFASSVVVEELKRLPGVGDAGVFGARDYAMRVWLRPDRMAALGVTSAEVVRAIRATNAQYAVGRLGQEPSVDAAFVVPVIARGRLASPEQFGEIVLRSTGGAGVLRLRDVARVELGSQSYEQLSMLDGKPVAGIRVFLQTGSNALETADRIRARLDALTKQFPPDVEYSIPFDTTRFVRSAIGEVRSTLLEAAFLVAIVVFLFLGSWRATLIPMIAVPVSLIGACAGLWVMGYWRVPWQLNAARVGLIDTGKKAIGLVTASNPNNALVSNGIGDKYNRPLGSKKEPWWVINLLEEIDQPGEWCVDFSRQRLYFLMDRAGAPADGEIELSDVGTPLVQLDGASDIRIQGLSFRRHLGLNVQILNGARNLVLDCDFSQSGNFAIDINGGTSHGVVSSNFEKMASGGVMLRGGTNSPTLTAADHFAVNNKFRSFGEVVRVYQSAIDVGYGGPLGSWGLPTVGMRVAHNDIRTSPHAGILWNGYQNVIEYNELSDFTRVSNDLGGIYRFGPNIDSGTVIRYNHLYSSPQGEGIYNDFDHVRTPIYGNTINLKTPSTSSRGYGIWTATNTAVGGAVPGLPMTLQVFNNIAVNSRSNYALHSATGGLIQNNLSYRKLASDFLWTRVTTDTGTNTNSIASSNAATLQSGLNPTYSTDPGFIDFANDDRWQAFLGDADPDKDQAGSAASIVRNSACRAAKSGSSWSSCRWAAASRRAACFTACCPTRFRPAA